MLVSMGDLTHILNQIAAGDSSAHNQLYDLVYDELRRIAAGLLANEKPGQTLQPTALVNDLWLKIAAGNQQQVWNSKAHFFAAAAEAILAQMAESGHTSGALPDDSADIVRSSPARHVLKRWKLGWAPREIFAMAIGAMPVVQRSRAVLLTSFLARHQPQDPGHLIRVDVQ